MSRCCPSFVQSAPNYLRTVQISTPTQTNLLAFRNLPDSAEFSCQGNLFMGNVFSQVTVDRTRSSRIDCEPDHPDSDLESDVISLLEENARLRTLVTQLSDLVLRHVANQK